MVFRFAGNSLWSASQHLGLGIVTPVAPQDVAYAISYSLLVGAMLHLVALTSRRITLVSALDAGAVPCSSCIWHYGSGWSRRSANTLARSGRNRSVQRSRAAFSTSYTTRQSRKCTASR